MTHPREPGLLLSLRSFNELEDLEEVEGEEEDNNLVVDSPEPPSPVEPDDTMETEDEDAQPGRKHPEQELPHIFKVGAPQVVCLHNKYYIIIRNIWKHSQNMQHPSTHCP